MQPFRIQLTNHLTKKQQLTTRQLFLKFYTGNHALSKHIYGTYMVYCLVKFMSICQDGMMLALELIKAVTCDSCQAVFASRLDQLKRQYFHWAPLEQLLSLVLPVITVQINPTWSKDSLLCRSIQWEMCKFYGIK